MRDVLLLAHFTGLIIGAGAGFSVLVIGYLSAKFDAGYKRDVMVKLFPLRYISYLGLVLLISSGGGLIMPFLPTLAHMPWLIAKLLFVSLLVMLSASGALQMHRVKRGSPGNAFVLLGYIGKMSFASSLAIITCAVYSFH